MIIDGIDITTLLKARKKFEEYRRNIKTERDKFAAIQTFEFCFELAWKTMRRLLESPGNHQKRPCKIRIAIDHHAPSASVHPKSP